MCGIIGMFNYRDKRPIDSNLITQMMKTIRHRGPDGEGSYFCDEEAIALGHRRLAIIDLFTGHQPMCNEDETIWVVSNGEIYNFKDLRKELESFGHVFKTESDTETIIHAYEQWGRDAFSRLNGMYAFGLWDARNRILLLARDPFGVKPLYYWDNGHSLIFGSEIKPILCYPEVKREVNLEALDEFLTLSFVPSPRTAFSGINKLMPGYMLICSKDGINTHRFYHKVPELFYDRSEEDIVEELRDKLFTAVKRQMVSDVPIGLMLSGGVDSSTIATIMTEINGGPLETFTVGFEDDFKYNELNHARALSHKIDSHHKEVVVTADEYADFLSLSIQYLEEPIATASTLAFYKVCELASKHVKVALTGQGADEPFAGYYRHLGERYGSLYRSLPSPLRNRIIAPLVELLPRNERQKRAVRSLKILEPLNRFYEIYTIFDSNLKHQLYREDLMENDVTGICDAVKLWQSDVTGLDGLSQLLYMDARLSLADNLLIYGDKMSMAVSLEVRVPFLDLELMEFVERIPPTQKIKRLTQKYILKKAASKWISNEIIDRKKIGFTTPVDKWFQKELRLIVDEILFDPGSACRMFFKPQTIRRMLDEHQSKRHDHKRTLFSLLTFEMWHRNFIKPSDATFKA